MIWYSTRILAKPHFLQCGFKKVYQDPVQIYNIKVENSEQDCTGTSVTHEVFTQSPQKVCGGIKQGHSCPSWSLLQSFLIQQTYGPTAFACSSSLLVLSWWPGMGKSYLQLDSHLLQRPTFPSRSCQVWCCILKSHFRTGMTVRDLSLLWSHHT